MRDFKDFVDRPTGKAYLRLLRWLTRQTFYRPYSEELAELPDLAPDRALLKLKPLLERNLALSPRAHGMAASFYRKQGQNPKAEWHGRVCRALLEGIRATGNGSWWKPYRVARTSDEYDLLMVLERTPLSQHLLGRWGRHYDQFHFKDGSRLTFEITPAIKWMESRISR